MNLRMKAKKSDGMMEIYWRTVMDEKFGRNRGYPNRFPSTKMVNLIRRPDTKKFRPPSFVRKSVLREIENIISNRRISCDFRGRHYYLYPTNCHYPTKRTPYVGTIRNLESAPEMVFTVYFGLTASGNVKIGKIKWEKENFIK